MTAHGTRLQVFVRLLDEGVDVWRPTGATVSGDGYLLEGPVPEGERWEFQPGTLVRCRVQRFQGDSEKRLVAYALLSGGPEGSA